MTRFLFCLCLYGTTAALLAQEGSIPALDFLRTQQEDLGLVASDLAELRIVRGYASPSGVEHVYVGQFLYGTPVYNAQAAVHFRNGRVGHYTSRLEANIHERTAALSPSLSAQRAFSASRPAPNSHLASAELTYYPLPGNHDIRLAWQLDIENLDSSIHYLSMIDATDGTELYRASLTVSCQLEAPDTGGAAGVTPPLKAKTSETLMSPNDEALYHVFPFGLESPNDGGRKLLIDPSDPVASPYGWHDTDGKPGPEYTSTRGNNVFAYRDADEQRNQPDSGFVADGGRELDFDFPFQPQQSPDSIYRSSITQLFYLGNMIHDWTYRHGFDEAAGNFQQNNYGRGGIGNDPVHAESQDGAGSNNANFYTGRDGRSARMQMYLWRSNSLLRVIAPVEQSGIRATGGAMFGARINGTEVRAEVAIGRDGTEKPTEGCSELINSEEVRGKIAMLSRGSCSFQLKAYHAERAGAVGVIISNPANGILTMSGASEPDDIPVTIPAVLMRESDCQPLRQIVETGGAVAVELRDNDLSPLDGAFDNGVVAHEYGHGVSIRLVGGPQTNTCLLNDEQMGEGWSDFFLLASTPQSPTSTPTGTEPRSIGVYSTSSRPGARGLRSQYYSTDFRINNHTYDDVITAAVPHGLGEVWATTLWDIYWKMTKTYGFDADLVNGTGGNNAAVRLVIEAMKYTPCSPGLIDGRDALLIADRFENDGANQCLLWEVFQRRGLGRSATQGDSQFRDDNREAFDTEPSCIRTIKVSKSASAPTVTAGERIEYTLTVRNDKPDPATGITLTDELPDGLTIDGGSVRGALAFALEGNRLVFQLDDIAPGEREVIVYTAVTDPERFSDRLFFDGAEATETSPWTTISREGNLGWVRGDSLTFAGQHAWFIPNASAEQDQILQFTEPVRVTGTHPALRFHTRYRTEPAYDAGIVQVSRDGTTWENVDRRFMRFGYRGTVGPRAPAALRGTPSFWGDSEGYHEAIVDLSDFRDEDLYVRWRFVADASAGDDGWWIDNVEVLDLFSYNGEVTVTTSAGDRATAQAPELGVVVDRGELVSGVAGTAPRNPSVSLFPNPTTGSATVSLAAKVAGDAHIELWSAAGRRVLSQSRWLAAGQNSIPFMLDDLPAGNYTLRVTEPGASTVVTVTLAR
ncbi:putative repeat protein (TIGR01451 family) [Lewinella aquimaris]|uniref:Putative repeat protein (TIGR01451 family) n=1 Tax=Neolewinella aquimaris TaxID=1835722 RepID=A0A840E5V9_9BACT|nr:M36 family metallopeptidase [Neolewinella aquimaris]MBB4079102.1 putative repeat protein (TIGR01451 family) [Neolewinella aquimaris]